MSLLLAWTNFRQQVAEIASEAGQFPRYSGSMVPSEYHRLGAIAIGAVTSIWALRDVRSSFQLGGGSRTSSSPFEAEGPRSTKKGLGGIREAHFRLVSTRRTREPLANELGSSRAVPYGRAVPIGEFVAYSGLRRPVFTDKQTASERGRTSLEGQSPTSRPFPT